MLVQCKVTGRWYDPAKEFEKLLNSKEVKAVMKRLKYRE